MVCINTNPRNRKKDNQPFEFKHIVDIEGTKSFIATARNTDTNRLKVYFVTDECIYERQGLKEIWRELEGENYSVLARIIKQALETKRVARFTTNTIVTLN